MREIKFRAWDFDLKQMKRVLSVEWLDEMFVTYWNEPGIARANCVLMQFTGLHDVKGKHEVYEGDILKGLGVVEFQKGQFVTRNPGMKPVPLADDLNVLGKVRAAVIGNIYENPELLKV